MMRTRRCWRPATSARSREIAMQTLADLFIDTDKRQSAIILPEDGTEIGYGSLSDQVDRLAARLRQSGLDPGQVVAIALPNGIEHLVAFLTATRARLIAAPDRKSTRLNSSHGYISYAVFCLKKKKTHNNDTLTT